MQQNVAFTKFLKDSTEKTKPLMMALLATRIKKMDKNCNNNILWTMDLKWS